jgi:AcrR family transcriptional regulator
VTRPVEDDLEGQARSAGLLEGVRPEASQRLLIAGVDLFADVGFHATTTRDLAQRAGLSPAALYVHYRSKQDLLGAIMLSAHRRVVNELEAAVDRAGDDVVDRFRALAQTFARWHAEHTAVARIAVNHLLLVPEEQFREVRVLRGRIVGLFEDELRAGLADGSFAADDVHYVTLAVLSLTLDLARWYSTGRPWSPDQISELYGNLAIRMVAAR